MFLYLRTGEECFKQGECRDSQHAAGEPVSDEFACLDFCKSEPRCAWATFAAETGYCELLENCSILDAEICPNCLTGQRDCIPDDPQCMASGECEGTVDFFETLPTVEECLGLCNSTIGCRWITFHTEANECILFKNCPTIDESCKSCVSSERRCLQSQPTTTISPSTTTTPEKSKTK